MKKLTIPLLGGLGLLCGCLNPVMAQKLEFSRHQTKEITLTRTTGEMLALIGALMRRELSRASVSDFLS